MTVVVVDVRDVAGLVLPTDRVEFRSPAVREGPGGSVVSTHVRTLHLVGGVGEIDLVPGPVSVLLRVQGSGDVGARVGVVPDVGPVSLAEVIRGGFDYSPPVVSVVAADAARAVAAADRVEQAATSTSWDGDRLTVLGKMSPPLTGPPGAVPVVVDETWWVDGVDTGVRAQGPEGRPGVMPPEDRALVDDAITAGVAAGAARDEAVQARDDTVAALGGKADLVNGEVPTSQIPAVALTKPHAVDTRAGMLALDAQEGDVAIITDGPDKGSYMLGPGSPALFESWHLLAVSADAPVQSVNGQTGTVVLGPGDVGAAPVSHPHTMEQVTGLVAALDGKAATGHSHTPSSLGAAPSHVEVTGSWPSQPTPGTIYWKAE